MAGMSMAAGAQGEMRAFGNESPQIHHRPTPKHLLPTPSTSIFIPFPGLSLTTSPVPSPTSRTARLETIITNVQAQQNLVRQKNIDSFTKQAKLLSQEAKNEINHLYDGERGEDRVERKRKEEEVRRSEREMVKRECEVMIARAARYLRGAAKERDKRERDRGDGKKWNEEKYIWKPGMVWETSSTARPVSRSGGTRIPDFSKGKTRDGDGDVEMGGTGSAGGGRGRKRTAKEVRDQLSRDLKELVEAGIRELEIYDEHTKTVLEFYTNAFRRGSLTGLSSTSGPTPKSAHPGIQRVGSTTGVGFGMGSSSGETPTNVHPGIHRTGSLSGPTGMPAPKSRGSVSFGGEVLGPQSAGGGGDKKPMGILRNKSEKILVDERALRRMSEDDGDYDVGGGGGMGGRPGLKWSSSMDSEGRRGSN